MPIAKVFKVAFTFDRLGAGFHQGVETVRARDAKTARSWFESKRGSKYEVDAVWEDA